MLFRSIFRRRKIKTELEDELQDHLEQEIANNIRAGMTPDEAKFAAQRLIGSVALYKEECLDAWGTRIADKVRSHLRYALRTLFKAGMAGLATAVAFLSASATLIISVTSHKKTRTVGVV
jgi:hypothetical protein